MSPEGLRRMGRENPVSDYTPEVVDNSRKQVHNKIISEWREKYGE